MTIKQCRAVQAIADHGSFAAAAKALNLAQSAISMQVASFEETLGVQLFDRSHRPPRLTEAGETMLVHARAVVDEYDRMIDALSSGYAAGGALRIGVIPTVLTSILPAALMRLRALPNAPKVRIASALSGELIRQVQRGEVDAALIHRPAELPDGFAWIQIARQQIVVIAPADTTEADLGGLLARHPYIRFNRAAWVAPMIERRLDEMGLAPTASAEIQSIEAIRVLVGLGFGVSILPALQTPEANDRLRTLPFGAPPLYRSIGFLMRESLARRQIAETVRRSFAGAAGDPAEATA